MTSTHRKLKNGADPALHTLTFGPHQGVQIKDAPLDYVGSLAGYRIEKGKPTHTHPFDKLCYNIMIGHGSPCICKSLNNHSTKCLLFSWGSNPGITEGLLIDHIYSGLLEYHDAKELAPWVEQYVNHTDDVIAARQYIDNQRSGLPLDS